MSNTWIEARLEKMLPDPGGKAERQKIIEQLRTDKVTKIYAQRDPQGRSYHVIKQDDDGNPFVTGQKWEP